MNTLHLLQSAILNKTELDIIYDGGSRPGSVRRILPLAIRGDILRARSYGQTKSFKLDLIRMRDGFPEESLRRYRGIQDIIQQERQLIMDTGLIPETGRCHLVLSDKDHRYELSLRHQGRHWLCCGKEYAAFQEAAETFIIELLSYNLHKHSVARKAHPAM